MTPSLPLIAWTPDADPTTPGVITDVTQMLPTVRGYAPDYALTASNGYGGGTLPGRCYGAALLEFGAVTPVLVAGTANKLYRVAGNVVTDISRTTGGAYTSVTDDSPINAWRFDAIDDVALAVKPGTILQATTNVYGTPFADVTGAPGGATMAVQSGFVMIAGYSAEWPYANGWWCSALADYTDWTPDVATQSARGRLTQTPGGIIRVIAFQDDLIFFKGTSVIRATYVGTPTIWQFTVLSTDVGLAGHDAVAQADGILYWLGDTGFYRFNGGSIQRIASAPWSWMREDTGGTFPLAFAQAQWDSTRRVIRWYYPARFGGDALTRGLAYHVDTDRWGRFDAAIDWAAHSYFEYLPVSIGGVPTTQVFRAPIVIESAGKTVQTYAGVPGVSTLETGDIGDHDAVSMLSRVRPKFLSAPASAFGLHKHRMNLQDTLVNGVEEPLIDGKFDFSQSARWHRVRFTGTGIYEMNGFAVGAAAAGKR
jgi:hypothetical protein